MSIVNYPLSIIPQGLVHPCRRALAVAHREDNRRPTADNIAAGIDIRERRAPGGLIDDDGTLLANLQAGEGTYREVGL